MIMPVVILSGGFATRLMPISKQIPKAMMEFKGKPFIYWQMNLLYKAGVRDVVLCVHHKSDLIKKYIRDGSDFQINVVYSDDGESALGTGGAIINALHLVGDEFMVLYGDSYLPIDFKGIQEHFRNLCKPVMMTVYKNSGKIEPSNILFNNNCVQIYSKEEKVAAMEYIDYGLICFKKYIFREFKGVNPLDLASILTNLAQRSLVGGFQVTKPFYEVGSFAGIRNFTKYIEGAQREF